VPRPGCQPRVFRDSSEQSNHNAIVLAFAIKHEAAGTCRLLCGGTGRKPSCTGGAAAAGGAPRWQHRTQHPPWQGHFPGQPRSPVPIVLTDAMDAPGKERCQAPGCTSGSPHVLLPPWEGETTPEIIPGSSHSFPGSLHIFLGTACRKHSVKVAFPSSKFFCKGFGVHGGREEAKSKPLR